MSCDESYLPPVADFDDLYQGDRVLIGFLVEEPQNLEDDPDDPATVWVPRDLSGGELTCQARVGSAMGEVWVEPQITGDLAQGQFEIVIASAETETAVPGMTYAYDVQYTEAGENETLVRGEMSFEKDVTE